MLYFSSKTQLKIYITLCLSTFNLFRVLQEPTSQNIFNYLNSTSIFERNFKKIEVWFALLYSLTHKTEVCALSAGLRCTVTEQYTITHHSLLSPKAIPVTGRGGPQGCETSRLSHLLYTIVSQMAARLSALRSSRPLPPRRFRVLIYVRGWVDLKAIVRMERLDHLKIKWPQLESNPLTSSF
jgi:hypothetical protein